MPVTRVHRDAAPAVANREDAKDAKDAKKSAPVKLRFPVALAPGERWMRR
jgi:hypothetical protein